MRKIIIVCVAVILLTCTACGQNRLYPCLARLPTEAFRRPARPFSSFDERPSQSTNKSSWARCRRMARSSLIAGRWAKGAAGSL